MRKFLGFFAVGLVGAGAALALFFAFRQRIAAPAWKRLPRPDAFLVFSAEDLGYLLPCGCKTPPSGGVARRNQSLRDMKNYYAGVPFLEISGGNLLRESMPATSAKIYNTAIFRGLAEAGYRVLNLGDSELRAGPQALLRYRGDFKIDFMSSRPLSPAWNKIDVSPVWTATLRLPSQNETLRVGVTGWAEDEALEKADLAPLVLSIKRLRAENDLVILVITADRDILEDMTRHLPPVDLILASYSQALHSVEGFKRGGEAEIPLVYSGHKGGGFQLIRLWFSEQKNIRRYLTSFEEMTAERPEDPATAFWVEQSIEKATSYKDKKVAF